MANGRRRNAIYDPKDPGQVESLGDGHYRVQSFSNPDTWYDVDTGENTCTCPDFTYRNHEDGYRCKHLLIVEEEEAGD